ncbi:MAG: hypothetical protein ACH350_05670 [Parachlamydiaceae bacterium]
MRSTSLSRTLLFSFPSFLSAFIFSILILASLQAKNMKNLVQENAQDEVLVDLREPLYSDGVLSTEKGGVIKASDIRIQGKRLKYTRTTKEEELMWTIEGEGDLIIEFGEYVFVGEKICYDFQKKEGRIYQGLTALEPWFFGGKQLELKSDGSYTIHYGCVTTSESDLPDWGIYCDLIHIQRNRDIQAKQVSFKAFNFTFFKIPSLKANLNFIFDNPIRYRFRWGGRQGPRFGLTYELFSWKHWKTFFRFDYRLTRGPGAGIETYYRSEDRKTQFQNISYLAKDSSILQPHEKARYRFEGHFKKVMDQDKTTLLLTYDKISDRDMPSVYNDRDFDFDTADRTQLRIRREEEDWIGNFYIRARVNSFQTVKQELPTLETSFKPFALSKTGIICENDMAASYLNFEYSKYLIHVHNYSSSRFQYFPSFYRPFVFGPFFTLTPQIAMATTLYGDSPKEDDHWLVQGKGSIELQSQLYRYYGPVKHIIEPYLVYRYDTYPTSSPKQHYIFDLSDGLTHLHSLSFGIHHGFYTREKSWQNSRFLSVDLYSFAFFDTDKIHQTIPRIYGNVSFSPWSTMKQTLNMAWNIEHNQLDYFNIRAEWSVNEDIAIAAEYRQRGSYWWRKVDRENFFLDMFHNEERLKHSALSDRSNTLLLHFFYRMHPNWACEVTTRHGWNRRKEPHYFEFEFDVLTTIQTAWNLRLSYQHQENDDRVAMFLNVGLKRPSILQEEPRRVYCFE